jgi:(2Fe-2S) ferredoxin
LDAVVCRTGCIGFCAQEPLLDLSLPNGPRVSYANMTPEKTRTLLAAYAKGNLMPELALGRFAGEEYVSSGNSRAYPPCAPDLQRVPEWSNLDFYRRQKKIILRNCGSIDPMAIDETIARGTYRVGVYSVKLALRDFGRLAYMEAWMLSNSGRMFVRGGSHPIG